MIIQASLRISQVEKLSLTARRKSRTKLPQKSATEICEGETSVLFPFPCPVPNFLLTITKNITHKQAFCQAGFQLPSVCSKTSVACTTSAKANKETTVRGENGSEVGAVVSRGSGFNHASNPAAVPHLQGSSQPGRDVPHGCCLPHAGAQSTSATARMGVSHLEPISCSARQTRTSHRSNTHTNPFFHYRATTPRKLSYAEEDFSFTTRTQCCGRPADKTFCLAKSSIKLWLCCLHGCAMSSKGLTTGFAVRKVAL